ncbi:hypothetical protein Tsubulata_019337 [Turnera subulata]|uniref:Uncharacterized protein n=1 Tax=Turnera subulata TaxID=218843 RepID=A0A9Q0GCK4_9ROSI|nr:hypothetical protein Tsubulata_019337 [Turnera subulata]
MNRVASASSPAKGGKKEVRRPWVAGASSSAKGGKKEVRRPWVAGASSSAKGGKKRRVRQRLWTGEEPLGSPRPVESDGGGGVMDGGVENRHRR